MAFLSRDEIRDKNKVKAEQHYDFMAYKYKYEIEESLNNSKFYSRNSRDLNRKPAYYDENWRSMNVVVDDTTVGALEAYCDKYSDLQATVLNFASYNNPGGGYMSGSIAQEESLCHASNLYNILEKCTDFYEWNNTHKRRGLYTDRCIWTPNVKFETKTGTYDVNVITCAAPNRSVGMKFNCATEEENDEALKDRISFISKVFKQHPTGILVLGAYGCGVFNQKPDKVAALMKEFFYDTSADLVLYAIPKGANHDAFNKVFC